MSRFTGLFWLVLVLLVCAQNWQVHQLRSEVSQLTKPSTSPTKSDINYKLTVKDAHNLLIKASKYAEDGDFKAAQSAASQAIIRIEAATKLVNGSEILQPDRVKRFLQQNLQKLYQPQKEDK